MSSFSDQPLEIIRQIGKDLPLNDCINMIRVCKRYQGVFQELTQKKLKVKVLSRLAALIIGKLPVKSEYFESFTAYVKDIVELLKYLSEVGVIAGGSMVYALNNFVPNLSVGDIDIFINDKSKFLEAFRYLESRPYFENVLTSNPQRYFDHDPDPEDIETSKGIVGIDPEGVEDPEEQVSIVSFVFKDAIPLLDDPEGTMTPRPQIQLILQDFQKPEDVIESFDLDYVQCALHQDQIFMTEICKRSHIQKTVLKCTEFPPTIDRLEKALRKGFRAPVFGDEPKGVYKTPLELKLTEENLKPIQRRKKDRQVYDLTKIQFNGFKENNVEFWKYHEMKFCKITLLIDPLGSDLKGSVDVEYISTEIDVLDIPINKNKNESILIDPITLTEDLIITNCKNKSVKGIVGKQVVKAKLYFCNGVPKLQIDEVHGTTAISIPFPNLKTDDNVKHHISPEIIWINRLIKKHQKDSSNHLAHAKVQAYKCFLYYLEKENLEKAIKMTCDQMTYDVDKISNNLGFWGITALLSQDSGLKTVDQMIDFIEGFH